MSAYWIAHVTIHDMEQYKQYMATAPGFSKVRRQVSCAWWCLRSLEGQEFERHVVIEFPDMETARECYFHLNISLPKVNAKAAVMSW